MFCSAAIAKPWRPLNRKDRLINAVDLYRQLKQRLGTRGRNLGWNLAGQILPLAAGLVFLPLLVERLGTARFGFLSIVWVLIGYFSMFDLGLSRALTQRVAALSAIGEEQQLRTAVATGLALLGSIAAISVPLLLLGKNVVLTQFINTSPDLLGEASAGYIWLVLGVPIVIFGAGVRGLLEGQHRFAAVNLIRTPAGIAMFAAPWIASLFSVSVQWTTFSVFLVRLLQLIGFIIPAWPLLRDSLSRFDFEREEVKMLTSFGLWMTVSNIVAPILVYLDRFAIARLGGLSDVAYYSLPFDLVSRLLFISTAISGVMFPALSGAAVGHPHDVPKLVRQNYLLLWALCTPPILLIIVLAHPGLNLWVGPVFAERSTLVLQILALGVLINALTSVSTSTLHATRRADLTGKVQLIELPIYLGMLWLLVSRYGIVGAAVAWTLRVSMDILILRWLAGREVRKLAAKVPQPA